MKKLQQRIKPYLKPTMFISFGIAWIITNGWAYIMLGIGIYGNISWAKVVATSYLAVLWLPITPEKLITIPLAIWLQKIIFKKER